MITTEQEPPHADALKDEVSGRSFPFCYRLKLLFTPYIDYRADDNGAWSITVVPESLRAIFITSFLLMVLLGAVVTLSFKGTLNDFSFTNNPIIDTWGNNNACVFLDDPPFSYFAAALYMPVMLSGLAYVFVDLNRVYIRMRSQASPRITPRFYWWYRACSWLVAFSMCFFVQVFGTQPTQSLFGHWIAFGVLMWSFFLLSVQHFVYMLRTDVISPDGNYYWLGIAFLVFLGLNTAVKFFLDTSNVAGAHWLFTLAKINDPIYTLTVLIGPIFIYLLFVTKLDHVTFSMSGSLAYCDSPDSKPKATDPASATSS